MRFAHSTRAVQICAIVALCLATSCTIISREKGYPGGNIGYAADKQLFARGHEQRVARYMVAMALISPLIAETAETPIEAKLSAERLDAMFGRLARLLAAAKTCALVAENGPLACSLVGNPGATGDQSAIRESAYAFETLSFDVSLSLFNATEQIADNLGIRSGVNSVAGASRLNPARLITGVLGVRKILPTVLKYYATYRDVAVVLSASILEDCDGDSCDRVQEAYNALVNRPNPTVNGVFPIRALLERSYDYIDAGHPWALQERHYLALMFHVDRTCFILLQIQQQDTGISDKKDCRVGNRRGTGANAFFEAVSGL